MLFRSVETAKTAKLFGIDPKVAVLSFSTKGSGKGGTVALSHDAVIKAQEMDPELAIDGELQFDAAVAPEVAQVKCKGSKVAGQAHAGRAKFDFIGNSSALLQRFTAA